MSLDHIVVATSTDASDDALVEAVSSSGFDVIRGPLDDVLERYNQAIETYSPDAVVRLTADCPLVSPQVIDRVVGQFHISDCDYASNTLKPTFPDGLDVEVATAEALREVAEESRDPHEREHVTLGIYRRSDHFLLQNVVDELGRDNSHLRWTVDTSQDYRFVEAVYRNLLPSDGDFEYEDILSLLSTRKEIAQLQSSAARNAALNGLDTGAMEHPSAADSS